MIPDPNEFFLIFHSLFNPLLLESKLNQAPSTPFFRPSTPIRGKKICRPPGGRHRPLGVDVDHFENG